MKTGLLGLWTTELTGERRMSECVNIIHFHPEPSQPTSPLPMIFNPEKKKGEDCLAYWLLQRFLSIRIITSPITTIATMIPAVAGNK